MRNNFTAERTPGNVPVMRKRAAVRESVDLEQAVHLYYRDIYRFAHHLCRNAADAADLTQYAYERLTLKHEEIEEPAKVKGWLQSTLYRKFIDQKRHHSRFPKVEFQEEHPDAEHTLSEAAERVDARTALEALCELEDELRAPLSLFYLEACSYKEIAQTLGLPAGTVMSRLYRGKEKLYQLLTRRTS